LVACSILYNRAVYPEESFTKVKKYGLTMLLTQDEGVKTFITSLTSQLSGRFFLPSEVSRPWTARECDEVCPLVSRRSILQSGWRPGSCRGLCW
jgi:hypothetical protein